MHVVFVSTNLQKHNLITLLMPKTRLLQHQINLLIEHNLSALCWKDQVIQQHSDVVILMNELSSHLE